MSRNAPQTLSVKRKRYDAPVDSLVVEQNVSKRLRSDNFPALKSRLNKDNEDKREGTIIWKRIKIPQPSSSQTLASPPPETPARRFHVSRASGNVVLFEHRPAEEGDKAAGGNTGVVGLEQEGRLLAADQKTAPGQTTTPRKRPGAGTAIKHGTVQPIKKAPVISNGPSEETLRQFEKFSQDVENEEVGKSPLSPSKIKPKAPKLRFKDRHPEQAAALGIKDPNAMDIDSEEYVYDTYVREIIMPDANGSIPEIQGTIGFIVISEEDEEWWFGQDESDREFDTDDEDSNAEEYYANDYPEDEMSSGDEFDKDPYKHYHGEDNEEYDLDDDARSDHDDDQPFGQAVPKSQTGYWGRAGEEGDVIQSRE